MELALLGWRVLVTGGARRIGGAISRALAAQGATVAIHYHRAEGEALGLCRELQRGAFCVRGDLTKPQECEDVWAEAMAWTGGLDAVVNNAALFLKDDAPPVDLARMEAVNVEVPRRFMEWAKAAGVRRVINIGDAQALSDDDAWGGGFRQYCAGKRRMMALAKELATTEMPIAVVAPGPVLPPAALRGIPKGDDGTGLRLGPAGVAAEVERLLLDPTPPPFQQIELRA